MITDKEFDKTVVAMLGPDFRGKEEAYRLQRETSSLLHPARYWYVHKGKLRRTIGLIEIALYTVGAVLGIVGGILAHLYHTP